MELECITAEIPWKGIGYLVVRQCPADELAQALKQGVDALRAAGAREIFATSTDPDAPLSGGAWGGVRLTFAHEMLVMERSILPVPAAEPALDTADLAEGEEAEWLVLYNQGFRLVPNGATYTEQELQGALEGGRTCGFFCQKGKHVGIYELDLTGAVPHIEGVALGNAFRGRGLGRSLMAAVLARVAGSGAVCQLEVSTANPVARRLYESLEFQTVRVRSRWFAAEEI